MDKAYLESDTAQRLAVRPIERMNGLKYELVPCLWLAEEEITEFVREGVGFGEEINVLWQLEEMSVSEWKYWMEENHGTEYAAFLVEDWLAGVCRATRKPNYDANGKLGIYMRPNARGRGFGSIMIEMATEWCRRLEIERLTACVDRTNERSLKAFRKARWQPTGVEYVWNPVENPRIAIELSPSQAVRMPLKL